MLTRAEPQPGSQTEDQPPVQAPPSAAESAEPGGRLTVLTFFLFFAILGAAVLYDLLASLIKWSR
jgi:hypothetical protein